MISAITRCEIDEEAIQTAAVNGYAVLYWIDDQDRIIFVNNTWSDFAVTNQDDSLTYDHVLHKSLWDFIVDPETRLLYESILEKVRARRAVRLYLRCDAPDCRRRIRLEISLMLNGVVQFRSTTLKQEERSYVSLLDVMADRSERFLTMCSWCKRIQLAKEEWVEVEEAVNRLALFNDTHLPQLTHGICRDCYDTVAMGLD